MAQAAFVCRSLKTIFDHHWLGWWQAMQQEVSGVDWLAWLHGASLLGILVPGSLALLGGVAAWLAADR